MAKKPTKEELLEARIAAAADAFGNYKVARQVIGWLDQNSLLNLRDGDTAAGLAYSFALAYEPDAIKEAFVLFGGVLPAPRKADSPHF